jgi:L-threonylcarbamoyladenylate synthase
VDTSSAVRALRAGGLVVYPTETVYGLGVDASSSSALGRLVELKGRDAAKGISVLVVDLETAAGLLRNRTVPDDALALAEACWPGPLTIVLPAAESLPRALVGPSGGIGLRCSADPVAAKLLREFAGPITSTSANPSGLPPATGVDAARAYFGERVACYVDAGPRRATAASTVVEFFERRVILRRVGGVPVQKLAALIPRKKLEN